VECNFTQKLVQSFENLRKKSYGDFPLFIYITQYWHEMKSVVLFFIFVFQVAIYVKGHVMCTHLI